TAQYQARPEREPPGGALPAWLGRGGLDAQGLAPERFAEQRRGRGRRATNFRREQRPAQLLGQPRRIALPAAGLRGELNDWRFEVLTREDLLLPIGPVHAGLHLRREVLGPHVARTEVWLDPARHHLPVRLRLSQGDAQRWELGLQEEILQP
ncbi:MAG TPA: hypothetical protein VJN44_12095, partial [Roseateles sp.]|nr:hypothetical protein [Roseateles sp.]